MNKLITGLVSLGTGITTGVIAHNIIKSKTPNYKDYSVDNTKIKKALDIDDDIFYQNERYRGRDFSAIDFQNRIIKKSFVDSLPPLESTNFLAIAYNNLEEMLSVRLNKTTENIGDFINASFAKLDKSYLMIMQSYQKLFNIIVSKDRFNVLDYDDIKNYVNINYKITYNTLAPSDNGLFLIGTIDNKPFKILLSGDFIIPLKDRFVNEIDMIENVLYNEYSDRITIHGYIQNINLTTFESGERHSNFIFGLDESEEYTSDLDSYSKRSAIITTINDEDCLKDMKIRSLKDPVIIVISKETFGLRKFNSFLRKAFKESTEYFFAPRKKLYQYKKFDFMKDLEVAPIVVANPYYDYKVVLDFIHEMCYSDKIGDIYITIYRAFEESQIIKDLIYAANNGKNVFVNFELSARSNEYSNWEFSELLKSSGCMVTSSYFDLKVHAKCFLAVSKDKKHFYSHVATGNYNETTAKFYTDINYITKDINLGFSIFLLFDRLFTKTAMISQSFDHEVVMFAPEDIKNNIMSRIEIESAKGENGNIQIKCNNFNDHDIINALYKAADNGCHIVIICRTSCGIKYHKNIQIYSRIWQFLEHDRIYMLGSSVFIASADLLTRNLYGRIEVCTQIFDIPSKEQVVDMIHHTYLDFEYGELFKLDEDNRWRLVEK